MARSHSLLRLGGIAALLAATLSVAACSSASKTSTAGSNGTSTPPSSGTLTSSSGSGAAVDTAAAAQRFAVDQTPPTKLLYVEPLAGKVPAGKTFVDLACTGSALCPLVSEGVKAAVTALGWKYVQIPFQLADPSTLITAAKQALTMPNLVGVTEPGLPQAVWQPLIPLFEAANVVFVPTSAGPITVSSKILPVGVSGPKDVQKFGAESADGIIAASKGTGHILLINTPDIGAFADMATGFKAEIAGHCSECKVTEVNVSSVQYGNGSIPSVIVSALQKDPSLKYVQIGSGADGTAAAIASAGITGVKIFAVFPTPPIQADIKAGKVEAAVSLSYRTTGWLAVDAAARFATNTAYVPGPNTPSPDGGGDPSFVLNKDNFQLGQPSIDYPSDYQTEFKTMWGVN